MVAYSFKERFIEPIRRGLVSPYPDTNGVRPKRQTIRAVGRRRHARPGDILQLYYGMRTKQCRRIGVARCSTVDEVRILFDTSALRQYVIASIETVETSGSRTHRLYQTVRELNSFALSDGFPDYYAMSRFWLHEHGRLERFDGLLIRWDPI